MRMLEEASAEPFSLRRTLRYFSHDIEMKKVAELLVISDTKRSRLSDSDDDVTRPSKTSRHVSPPHKPLQESSALANNNTASLTPLNKPLQAVTSTIQNQTSPLNRAYRPMRIIFDQTRDWREPNSKINYRWDSEIRVCLRSIFMPRLMQTLSPPYRWPTMPISN